jgi:hypothetical protein
MIRIAYFFVVLTSLFIYGCGTSDYDIQGAWSARGGTMIFEFRPDGGLGMFAIGAPLDSAYWQVIGHNLILSSRDGIQKDTFPFTTFPGDSVLIDFSNNYQKLKMVFSRFQPVQVFGHDSLHDYLVNRAFRFYKDAKADTVGSELQFYEPDSMYFELFEGAKKWKIQDFYKQTFISMFGENGSITHFRVEDIRKDSLITSYYAPYNDYIFTNYWVTQKISLFQSNH